MKQWFCFLSLISICIGVSSAEPMPVTSSGEGWLEWAGEYPVLHLKGSEYEMGVQTGVLVGDRFQAQVDNLREIASRQYRDLARIPDWMFRALRRTIGAVYYVFFPKSIKERIQGILDGARRRSPPITLNRMDIAFINSLIDLTGFVGAVSEKIGAKPRVTDVMRWLGIPQILSNCDSMAVWGPRTKGGKTFMNRNTDIDTGNGVERYPLIVIEKKNGSIPIASASITGMLGVFAGMNAHGVGLGQIWATSREARIWTPWHLKIREIFLKATSAREAATLLSQSRGSTYGSNFVFADAGNESAGTGPEGFVVEATSRQMALFQSNDPKELESTVNGEPFGLPLPHAVLRGDVSMDPRIRARQTAANGPSGDPRTTGSYRDRYLGLYDRILRYERTGVLMGAEEAITISKETAMKNSNLLNAVYANSDRDLWVSYSRINEDGTTTQAYERDYVNIPFHRYLQTLHPGKSGGLRIQSFLPGKERNLVIRHLSLGRSNPSETFVSSNQEWTDVRMSEDIRKGDLLELRDQNSGDLIDRLVIR